MKSKQEVQEIQTDQDNKIAINHNIKDTVFRKLFSEKENTLSLYNAVSGKHYTDAEQLEIVTLENAIYMGMRNDIAYLIHFELHMVEHQSTVNPNMPYRFLQYVAAEFEKFTIGQDIYGGRAIKLPTPHFLVFYNGTPKQPELKIQKLSELYEVNADKPELELSVKVLNINSGYNEELKNNCRVLKDYMSFVERIRIYGESMPTEQAVDKAVDTCIDEGILKDFLLKNKAEVKRMTIFEYDIETHLKSERKIWREEGIVWAKIQDIIELLEDLGEIPDSLRTRLESETDMDRLSRIHKMAAKASDIQEFIEITQLGSE